MGLRLPVHIAPAGWTVFQEIFGKFAAAAMGIGLTRFQQIHTSCNFLTT